MRGRPRTIDRQVAEPRRRSGARAAPASEDMYLTADEEALLEQNEHERLTADKRRKKAPPAAT
jgi:hypothetical protein